MVRKVQVTRLKEQIHKLHDERDDFQLREAKLTQENSRYDDTLRYVTLRYVTFQVPLLCLGKMAKNSPLCPSKTNLLESAIMDKSLGTNLHLSDFSHMLNRSPNPTNNFGCRRVSGIFLEFKVRGRTLTDNCEYCITFPRIFVQDFFS